jgi:DNA-binding NtrC family response regulator
MNMIATDADCVAADPHLVYVIDDDARMRQFISTTVSQLGMSPSTFQDGKDALASLDIVHPAVVFLDVALLQSDALDVIRGLGALGYRGLVQLMSGGRPALLDAVRRIGVRHHMKLATPLRKPFGSDAIVALIASLAKPAPISSPNGIAAGEPADQAYETPEP